MTEPFKKEETESPEEAEATPASEMEGNETETLQKELEEAKNQMLRALAEAENTRKRAVKEREDASKYAISKFAKDTLSVADNLRRALDAIPEDLFGDARIKSLVEGIEATERELLKSFDGNGIRKISPEGEPFNANYHEVMFEVPGSGKPPGTVMQVIETGYILHDRLLRPARVGVAKDEGQGNGKSPGGQIDTSA
ncbi:MAG: nucleotide exchange factor GrpE [Alphaproteobacteria bacterium]